MVVRLVLALALALALALVLVLVLVRTVPPQAMRATQTAKQTRRSRTCVRRVPAPAHATFRDSCANPCGACSVAHGCCCCCTAGYVDGALEAL